MINWTELNNICSGHYSEVMHHKHKVVSSQVAFSERAKDALSVFPAAAEKTHSVR